MLASLLKVMGARIQEETKILLGWLSVAMTSIMASSKLEPIKVDLSK